MEATRQAAFLIEDDPDLAMIFSKALTAAEYDVKSFGSAEAAWLQLQTEVPHLILLDLNLPGMSGVEFLNLVRREESLTGVRVVVSSANHLLAETTHELADLVLVKPVAFGQLKELASRLRQM